MSDHTPAPWLAAAAPSSIVGWPVVGPGGRSICNLSWLDRLPEGATNADYAAFRAETMANGHLIAASPDLLKAAKRALAVLKATNGQTAQPGNVLDALEKAIAKATGATQ